MPVSRLVKPHIGAFLLLVPFSALRSSLLLSSFTDELFPPSTSYIAAIMNHALLHRRFFFSKYQSVL